MRLAVQCNFRQFTVLYNLHKLFKLSQRKHSSVPHTYTLQLTALICPCWLTLLVHKNKKSQSNNIFGYRSRRRNVVQEYVWLWGEWQTPNLPLAVGRSGRRANIAFLCSPDPPLQTANQLPLSRFCTIHGHYKRTDRPIDRTNTEMDLFKQAAYAI